MTYNHPDPLLVETVALLSRGNMPKAAIARKSGLSESTIRNWMGGKTRRPQSISLQFALQAAGYKLVIMKE